MKSIEHLSRRERQIMSVVYHLGESSVADVLDNIPNPPSYSTVRALLGLLKRKGQLRHRKRGRAYLYSPVVSRRKAQRSVLKHVTETFFSGSVTDVVSALIDASSTRLSDQELLQLEQLIQKKRREEKKK